MFKIWDIYNWSLSEDADCWRYCRKKSPQAFDWSAIDAKEAYSICKDLFHLLPEPPYYRLVQIVIWCECMAFQGFLKWSKDVKIAWWYVCTPFPTPSGIKFALNSLGNMRMGIDMQQDDDISEFISKVFLDLGMQLLRHMTITVGTYCVATWFAVQKYGTLNVKENSQYHFTSGCLWLEFLHSMNEEWGVFIACVLVFLLVQSGKAISYCPSQSTTEKYHPQCAVTANVPAISRCSAVCVCLSRHGTHWEHTLWYPKSSRIACRVLMLIVSSNDGEWPACLSLPTAILTYAVFCRLVTNVSWFQFWHVCHSVRALLEHRDNPPLFSSINNTHLPMNFSKLMTLLSKKLNDCLLVLFWQVDHLVCHISGAM